MKQSVKRFLYAAFLMGATAIYAKTTVTPYYSIRSQSEDSARELVGWAHQVNLFDMQQTYGSFAITPEYTRSFRSQRIAECLFGDDLFCDNCCPTIHITGSRVENRRPTDWLADYFGLAPDFQGEVNFCPRVSNVIVDFSAYFGLDEWIEGLYFRVHAPLVHTRWELNFCESICDTGTAGYVEGYFAPESVPRSNLLNCFTDFISNCQVPTLNNDVVFHPLCCCKWHCGCDPLTETRLSDIQVAFGWNYFRSENLMAGFNFRAAIPTGTRPKGDFLFEPIVGNGHHWEAGVGFSGHYTFWRSDDEERSMGIYIDANFTHLFGAQQCRCFDLCNGPNSRYMLAERISDPVLDNLQGGGNTPNAQFKSFYSPVCNLTHIPVTVSIPIQADITFMFNLQGGNWEWDLGYNYWGRSCEKIKFRCYCPSLLDDGVTWALKGDAQMFGFQTNNNNAVALSASDSLATINRGSNRTPDRISLGIVDNANIDNPQLATGNGVNLNESTTSARQIYTSIDPIFLSEQDIDCASARTRGASNKIFTHISYVWRDRDRWIPYLGFGGKVEFAQDENDCKVSCAPTCDIFCQPCASCRRCNLSEWGVWLKGGVSFQ